MNVLLNPPSHQIFANRDERALALSTTAIPPTLSDTLAATTNTAIKRPSVSTTPKVFLPEIFFPASYPLVERVTVGAPRTLRASMTPAEGLPLGLQLLGPSRGAVRRFAPRSRLPTRSRDSGAQYSSADSNRAVPATDNLSPPRRESRSRCRAFATWWVVRSGRDRSR